MSRLPRIRLGHGKRRYAGLACGAISVGVVGALLLGPSPVTPGAAPDQDPPADSIVGKEFEDVATAELTGASGKVETPKFVPRQVLIGFERDATRAQRSAAISSVDGEIKQRLPIPGVVVVRLTGRTGVETAQQRIDGLPGVRYAEQNGIYRLDDTTPTDPYYPYLWGMENTGQEILGIKGTPDADIDAGAAWDVTKGSSSVIAAVVDTGVDFEHDDLAQQFWTNPADPKNGVDDDGNGYVDDTNGWDFVNSDARPDDDHYHGTHVAGTIAARTDDGKGVTGVAPNTTIMPLKVLNSSGSGTSSSIASAFAYAAENGARLANASLGGTVFSQVMLDSIKTHPNTLYVIAAGNSAKSNESSPHYPCSYDAENIICVAATDSSDRLASFSNWGETRVDLAAPGVKILSDLPGIENTDRKVLFSEDFEEPLAGNWTTTGTAGRWAATDEKAYSGNGSLTDRPYENYRAGDSGRIYTPAFDLRGETDCRWGMTGMFDPARGDTGFSGKKGYTYNGSSWSGTGTGDRGWTFDDTKTAPITASDFRMFIEMNAGAQATGGRGVFADNMWLTCADNSPKPIPPSRYGYLNGTSMATPHVAGAVALVSAANPGMSAAEIKQRILSTVDPVASLGGKTVSGGRLNVASALASQTTSRSGGDGTSPTPVQPAQSSPGQTASIATEPQPVDTSLYGKDRYLPWLEGDSTSEDTSTAGDQIVSTSYRWNVPDPALLQTRTSTSGGYTMLNGQWGLDNAGQNSGVADADIDAPEAWRTSRGSSSVTVALMSSGYPLRHPGLADNIAINPGESGNGRETNGLDDDRNGYIDDWRGLWTDSYSSGGNAAPQKYQPVADNRGQGTMTASLIAGDPSQGGRIFGISPQTKILPIKVVGGPDWSPGSAPGSASSDDLEEGIRYAGRMRADIAVLPVVGDADQVQGSTELISSFPRTLFVAPTGMADLKGAIPACRSSLENLICVRASTRSDSLMYPTRFFPGIDLAAPGDDMVATGQEWEFREAVNFDGSDLPGTINSTSSPGSVGIVEREGMDGGDALAFSPSGDLPRGASARVDFTGISAPADVRSCGTTLRFSRAASLGQTIGIGSWADPWYRAETTQRVTGRGRFTELTRFWDGLMEGASLGWLRKWSVYTSAPAEAWTSRDLIDSFGYTCPETEPTGNSIAGASQGAGTSERYGLDAALVGGTASLVKSEHPGFTPSQIRRALLDGSDSIAGLAPMVPGGKRLNAAGALAAAATIEPSDDQPQVRIVSGAEATNDATPAIGFWSKNADTLECSFDDGTTQPPTWTPCSGTTEHAPTSPLADGAYTFRIRASSPGGKTATDDRRLTIDTRSPAPVLILTGPTLTDLNIGKVWWNLRGERGATFECRLEGVTAWEDCGLVESVGANDEVQYELADYVGDGTFRFPDDGDFTFRARQADAAGNVSAEVSQPLTIDRAAPTPADITSAPPQLLRTNAAAFVWNRDSTSWATDIYLDGKKIGFMTGSPTASRYTFRDLADGPHVARFDVRDQAGNFAAPIEYRFEVQTDPLVDAPVFDPSSPSLSRAFPRIWFSGANGATYECSVDSAAFVACNSPWARDLNIYPTFREGPHSLRVRQVTPAGDLGPTSEFIWTVDSTPPSAPAITSGPSGATSANSASFSFTGETDAKFQCRLDSSAWSECVSGKSHESLPEGPHSFEVRQSDRAGNFSSVSSRTWTVDTTPPTLPSIDGGPQGLIGSGTAVFAFSGAGDGEFLCAIDGGAFASCASTKIYTGLAEGEHSFQIKRRDTVGNETTPLTRSFTVDTTPPTAPAVSSAPRGVVGSTSVDVEFSGESGSDFTCSLDGGEFDPCQSPVELANLTDGPHALEIRQSDRAGNISPVSRVVWSVDVTAANAPEIISTPDTHSASDTASFAFAGETNATFTCSLDGGEHSECSPPQTFTSLADGPHSFSVRQIDPQGNASAANTFTWTIDTVAPSPPVLDSGAGGPVSTDSASFRFSGEESASFECRIDAEEWIACESGKSYESLAEGPHTFEVRQTDRAGHTSAGTSRSWTVDTIAPSAPVISPEPNGLVSTKSASFTFTGEAGVHFECKLDTGGWETCTPPKSYLSLAEGSHSFQVRQSDPAGNTSSVASRSWSVDTLAPPLIAVRTTKRARCCRFKFGFTEAEPALAQVEFSTARTKPPASAVPGITYPLTRTPATIRLRAIPNFARVRDAAGNWSGWVAVRG